MAWYDQITNKFVRGVANRYMQESVWPALSIFPKIDSTQKSGYIAEYTKEDWLRVGDPTDYIRTGASESVGEVLARGKQSYILEEYAFHDDVTKDERDNYDNPFDPVSDATEFVVNRLSLIIAKKFVSAALATGIWGSDVDISASGAGGKWSTATGEPITDILTQSEAIESFTGFRPNKIVMTRDVYNKLKTNPQIKDSMKVTTDKVVTSQLLARLFEVDQVEVFSTVETTAAKGETATTSNTGFMASDKLLLCYAPSRPSKRKPSAGYHITYKGKGGNIATRTIPMPEKNDALRVEGSIYIQPKIVASDLGVLLHTIV